MYRNNLTIPKYKNVNNQSRYFAIECGTPSETSLSMRIVGGRRASPHSFPWTVAIVKNNRMHCGGAFITNKHVLSAGHCFKWYV